MGIMLVKKCVNRRKVCAAIKWSQLLHPLQKYKHGSWNNSDDDEDDDNEDDFEEEVEEEKEEGVTTTR